MGKAKYILLDCDNTLCQSERLAFEACADLTNEVLAEYKIAETKEDKANEKWITYTAERLLVEFVGQNFRGMLGGLQEKYNFTIPADELDKYVAKELDRVTKKLSEKATECPGVTEQLEWLKKEGYPMSVVSTSAKSRVVASLRKTNLDHFFLDEHVYSAATSLNPPSSKPEPDIYHHACKELGVKESEAITVEDSRSGATAAMRAGIPCIGYVGIYGIEDGKDRMEKMAKVLTEETKCAAIMYDWKEFPEVLKKIEAKL